MSLINKFTDYDLNGQAQDVFENKFNLFVVITIIVFNLIPICLYLCISDFKSFDILAISTVLWYGWLILMSVISTKHPKSINTFSMPLLFQIVIPMLIGTYMLRKYVLRNYPNTNDPDEILKFKRKQKIKSIL